MVVPLYISEISPPEIRGTLLVLEELSIVVGIVVSFWITYGTQYIHSHWSWQLPFLLQIVPGLILGFAAIFLPFSPRWLASQGREQEALVELAKLRRLPATDARVQKEWSEIITDAKFQAATVKQRHPSLAGSSTISKVKLEFAGWVDCVRPGCWRRTLVGAGLMFFQQVRIASRATLLTKKLTWPSLWASMHSFTMPRRSLGMLRVSSGVLFHVINLFVEPWAWTSI